MTIQEFMKRYTLHDSLVKRIQYVPSQKELRLLLDFCWWGQENEDENMPQPDLVELVFNGVPQYQGPEGTIDDYSVLWLESNDKSVTIHLLDDFHDASYDLSFQTDGVSMSE